MFRKYVKTVWERTEDWVDIFGLAMVSVGLTLKCLALTGSPKYIQLPKAQRYAIITRAFN